MILAFTFVAFHDVNCETSQTTDKPIKGNVEATYHPHQLYISNPAAVQQHQAKDLFYHNKDLLTANQGQVPSLSSKQTPSTVLYRDDSTKGPILNYPTGYYQTIVPQRSVPDYNIQTVAGTSHVPLTANGHGYLILSPVNQHTGFYQPTNQYSVAQPFVESSIRQPQVSTGPVQFYNAPAYSHFQLPVQPQQQPPQFYERPTTSFQKFVQHSNQQITQQTVPTPNIQPVETPKQAPPAAPQKTDFQFKTPPLFQHHVYHPLHTTVKHQPQQKIIHRPQKPSPPTPPRIYKVFTPMIPRRVIPVTELPVQQQQNHNRQVAEEEENEDKAEVNEEEDDDDDERENEKIEEEDDDSDHSDVKEEDHDDEEDFRPRFRFSGKHRHHDEDHDHPHSRYRHHDDDDHDSADTKKYTKNIKPKSTLPVKHKYPKNFATDFTSQFNPSFYEHKARPGPDFEQPKVEVKMYKYTRSSNEPQKTEYIEGNGSELKPVIQHNQKTYQSKWIVSTKTSSSTN